jgi:hypothetical protein
MRLFGRKRRRDDVESRCPHCREPLPEGAEMCVMCGIGLRPLWERESAPQGTTSPRRIA